MKIENIKTALKARAAALNLNPQENKPPVIVDAPVSPKPDMPTVTPKPSVTKNSGKNSSPQIPLINPVPVDNGDKVAPIPTGNAANVPAEKPARKPATRKAKETPAPVVQTDDIEVIVAKHLKAGRDYDRLPNTTKPTLLKAGAEILASVFGFRTTAKVINRVADYEKHFVLYEVQVTVFDKDGNIVAEGLGSCNSRERKYLKTDFATNLNTVLKIAKKRAFVDAILTATHASKVFTQDIEDIINLQVVTDNRVENIR